MTLIQIKGHGAAVQAATWLKSKGWQYQISLTNNNPFNSVYCISILDSEQAMIFKLTFGDKIV